MEYQNQPKRTDIRSVKDRTIKKTFVQALTENVGTGPAPIVCPYCNSSDIVPISGPQRKAFSTGKAVAGGLLTGGIGLLAGFAGKKGKKAVFMCQKCHKTFKAKV